MTVTDYKYGVVSAYDYSVDPGGWTGTWSTSTNMKTAIQNFLNNSTAVPDGSTAYFPPGTYKCDAAITCDRPINISAAGVTFDFGTSFDSASSTTVAFTFGKAASPGNIMTNLSVTGLRVTRTTPSGPASTDCKGVGFRWYGIQRCTIGACASEGFEKAHWFTGAYLSGTTDAAGQGNQINIYEDLFGARCKYGLYLAPGDSTVEGTDPNRVSKSGWCNDNVFLGGRIVLNLSDPANCFACYVQWQTVGSPPLPEAHEVNNNRFLGVTLESAWGRKVYCEGRFNQWIGCRWEVERGGGATDIEFKDTNAGGGKDNVLFYGFDLQKQVIVGPAPASPNYTDFNSRYDILTNPGAGIYGDGSDSALTLSSGTQTLTRDMYYTGVAIAAGATLKTSGYRLFCKSLNNAGTISNDGAAGGNAAAAAAGAAGAAATANTVGGSSAGTAGIAATTGNGSSATAPTATIGEGGAGGYGGAGGGAGSQSGGAQGAAVSPTLAKVRAQTIDLAYKGVLIQGGVGGRGGSSGAGEGAGGAKGGGGGGAGAGGGVLFIAAKTLVNTGTIRANGGAGGDGGWSEPPSAGETGGGGGGGAGGGGFLFLITDGPPAGGTIEASGGAFGHKGTGQPTDGSAGAAGADGRVVQINRVTGSISTS